jgi:hypothetical protein
MIDPEPVDPEVDSAVELVVGGAMMDSMAALEALPQPTVPSVKKEANRIPALNRRIPAPRLLFNSLVLVNLI